MNIKELREMMALMKDNDLMELEYEKDGERIRLKKSGGEVIIKEATPMMQHMSAPLQSASGMPAAPAAAKEDNANIHLVRSPMVGTFYAAPSPDQAPYVAKGTVIKKGDVLCIIEAMKLMNEIRTEIAGKVIEVLVEGGQAVEFDQPLFKIELA